MKGVDKLVNKTGIDVPIETPPQKTAGFETTAPLELDLESKDISSIIWATGYEYDFNWIHLPVRDLTGYPEQERGVTAYPGLYFVGLHFLHTLKSGLFYGIDDDAAHVAAHIAENR